MLHVQLFIQLLLLVVAAEAVCKPRPGERRQPWLVRIGVFRTSSIRTWPVSGRSSAEFGWLCAGTLVAPQAVLTAAHCVHGSTSQGRILLVRAGEYNTSIWEGCEQDRYVSLPVIHPSYNRSSTSRSNLNDLAVLQLDRPLLMSSSPSGGGAAGVAPVALPLPGLTLRPGTVVMMAGWGETVFGHSDSASEVSKRAIRRVLPMSRCLHVYPPVYVTSHFPGGLNSRLLTCVSAQPRQAICKGDSGGPAVALVRQRCSQTPPTRNLTPPTRTLAPPTRTLTPPTTAGHSRRYCNVYTLVGLINTGISCGSPLIPSINLAVLPHVQWLRHELENIKSRTKIYQKT